MCPRTAAAARTCGPYLNHFLKQVDKINFKQILSWLVNVYIFNDDKDYVFLIMYIHTYIRKYLLGKECW